MNKFFFTVIGSASIFQLANSQNLQEAITKTENERFDLAGSEFRQLINKEATKGDNYFYYGENFYKNDKIDSALIIFKKGTDVQPTNGLNFVGIGKVLLLQNKVADANTNLFKAKTLAGKNANV